MQLVAQGSQADAEHLGGFGAVVLLAGKRLQDELFLHLGQGDPDGDRLGGGLLDGAGEVDIDVVGVEDLGRVHHNGPFDHVGKFADVAWPVVVDKLLAGGVGELLGRFLILFAEALEEKFRQGEDVFLALPERGKMDGNDIEPVVEVFAEDLLFDSLFHGDGWRWR